MKLDGN